MLFDIIFVSIFFTFSWQFVFLYILQVLFYANWLENSCNRKIYNFRRIRMRHLELPLVAIFQIGTMNIGFQFKALRLCEQYLSCIFSERYTTYRHRSYFERCFTSHMRRGEQYFRVGVKNLSKNSFRLWLFWDRDFRKPLGKWNLFILLGQSQLFLEPPSYKALLVCFLSGCHLIFLSCQPLKK